LDDEGNKKRCLHIFMGATAEGRKERIAFMDGVRESKKSWQELLLDIKDLGLSKPVKLAVDNGALWLLGRSPRGISLDQDAASRRIGMPSWPPATSRLGTGATYGRPTHRNTFATIGLRHGRTKGSGSRKASLTMIFKLAQSASRRWRRLNGYHRIALVLEGRIVTDRIL
jgi:Transposase, Mutator family